MSSDSGSSTTPTTTTTRNTLSQPYSLSEIDQSFVQQAIECARNGLGHTFPNPAVGCVIVKKKKEETKKSDDDDEGYHHYELIGQGFHPKSGYPHAEVFALLEAAGHVKSGIDAALSVINRQENPISETLKGLMKTYIQDPAELFDNTFVESHLDDDEEVTAYVTLEPCCHTKKQTPPCALTLAMAKVDRVVVACRDPNPAVNGGGVRVLQDFGVNVDVVSIDHYPKLHQEAYQLIYPSFVKRITAPKPDYSDVNGKMRKALRVMASTLKSQKQMAELEWVGASVEVDSDDLEEAVHQLILSPSWMEQVDGLLWEKELVSLRLSAAIRRKKGVKILATRIAAMLQAHVAQVVGHTCLLYRPGLPPRLDLMELIGSTSTKQ